MEQSVSPSRPHTAQGAADGEAELLPRAFFALQTSFARRIADTHGYTFADALLDYTTAHRRLYHHPSKGVADGWNAFAARLTADPEGAADIFYTAYLECGPQPAAAIRTEVSQHGCFGYDYRDRKNTFVIHFQPVDPLGNLGRARIAARMEDLTRVTQDMKAHQRDGAQVRISSWLLGIEAFTRLFPPTLRENIVPIPTEHAQDMGVWGQFLDGAGGLKTDMAETLLSRAGDARLRPIDCFPIPPSWTVVPQEVFFDYYLGVA